MSPETTDVLKTFVVALLGAGILGYARSGYQGLRARFSSSNAGSQRMHTISEADQSLLVIARARDELGEDLDRCRRERAEDVSRFVDERTAWELERIQLKNEINRLEKRLRELLNELIEFRNRNGLS